VGMGKETRHVELQQEIVAELKSLRAQVRETAEGFILRKEGEIEALLEYLLAMRPGRLKSVARPWILESRGLKLKPAKGRIKDLKKIDSLLHDLLNNVIEGDVEEEKPKVRCKRAGTGRVKTPAIYEEIREP